MQTFDTKAFVMQVMDEDKSNAKYIKRVVVLSIGAEETVPVVFTNDNIKPIVQQEIKTGDTVHLTFKVRGWGYNGKYYSQLDGLSIDKIN